MKKILAIAVFAALVAVAVFVPREIHISKQAYEDQMVAVIGAIKARLIAAPTTTPLSVGIYAPVVDRPGDGQMLAVLGVVSLRVPGGNEHAEWFTAEMQDNCKGRINAACLDVRTLVVKGTTFKQAGELAAVLPKLPFQYAKPEPAPVQPARRGLTGGAPAKGLATSEKPMTARDVKPAARVIAKKAEAKPQPKPRPSPSAKRRTEAKPRDEAPVRPVTKVEAKPRDEAPAPPVAKAEARPVPDVPPVPPAPSERAAKPSGPPIQPARAAIEPPPLPAVKDQAEITADSNGPADQGTGEGKSPTGKSGGGQTELSARFPETRSQPAPPPAEITDSPNRVLQIQLALRRFGYDPGPADNVVGDKTRSAILAYQRQNGLKATGEPSFDLLKYILGQRPPAQAQSEANSGAGNTTFGSVEGTETASLSSAVTSDRIAQIQRALRRFGYDTGKVDNVVGPKTRAAIMAYQRRNGLEPTGEPTRELLNHIRGVTPQTGTP